MGTFNKQDLIHQYENLMGSYPPISVKDLDDLGFFELPASVGHHGKNAGDLFRHSAKVAELLTIYTERLNLIWERPESPLIIGLYHDLCKCDNYEIDFKESVLCDGIYKFKYADTLRIGHGDKSVAMINKLMELTEEEEICIRYHMGIYDNKWDMYDKAITQYPNVLYTHTADMHASKILNI